MYRPILCIQRSFHLLLPVRKTGKKGFEVVNKVTNWIDATRRHAKQLGSSTSEGNHWQVNFVAMQCLLRRGQIQLGERR